MASRLTAPLLLIALLSLPVSATSGQSAGSLRDRIAAGKARERSLAAAVARLGALERETAREVAILERRVAAVRSELAAAQVAADRAAVRLGEARDRVARLRRRLAQVRARLALLLRERYTSDQPDLVTVVLNADGFPQLLETMAFLRAVERYDTQLLALVRGARRDAGREQRAFARLTVLRRAAVAAVARRERALTAIVVALRGRRDALAQARAARRAALSGARAQRRRAQRTLARLLAERRRAALAPGPGGPWAIPWPVVQCESGGQNLPPNSASASGYYQILDSTWAGLGGSTRHAFEASKAEQDRLAARLWAGGRGAHNWVCAALVGIV